MLESLTPAVMISNQQHASARGDDFEKSQDEPVHSQVPD